MFDVQAIAALCCAQLFWIKLCLYFTYRCVDSMSRHLDQILPHSFKAHVLIVQLTNMMSMHVRGAVTKSVSG